MAALRIAVVALMTVAASPAAAYRVAEWRPYIDEASRRCGIPTSWIERVMRAESGGRTTLNGRPIRSSVGAIGLMQLMPATWDGMRRELGLGTDPDDPRDNILAGTCYLRSMYDRFGYPGLFAAYNAGPARYANHLATGRALPAETIAYLGTVGGAPANRASVAVEPHREELFVVRRITGTGGRSRTPPLSSASLFLVRNDGR